LTVIVVWVWPAPRTTMLPWLMCRTAFRTKLPAGNSSAASPPPSAASAFTSANARRIAAVSSVVPLPTAP
jgi:hypothetical protein